MSDELFKDLLAWYMCSDPWVESVPRERIRAFLNEEARNKGYDHWVAAYHEMP